MCAGDGDIFVNRSFNLSAFARDLSRLCELGRSKDADFVEVWTVRRPQKGFLLLIPISHHPRTALLPQPTHSPPAAVNHTARPPDPTANLFPFLPSPPRPTAQAELVPGFLRSEACDVRASARRSAQRSSSQACCASTARCSRSSPPGRPTFGASAFGAKKRSVRARQGRRREGKGGGSQGGGGGGGGVSCGCFCE